jgi:hypothetical protein
MNRTESSRLNRIDWQQGQDFETGKSWLQPGKTAAIPQRCSVSLESETLKTQGIPHFRGILNERSLNIFGNGIESES